MIDILYLEFCSLLSQLIKMIRLSIYISELHDTSMSIIFFFWRVSGLLSKSEGETFPHLPNNTNKGFSPQKIYINKLKARICVKHTSLFRPSILKLRLNCFYSNLFKCETRVNEA